MICNLVWIIFLMPCESVVRQSNILMGRSNPGWVNALPDEDS